MFVAQNYSSNKHPLLSSLPNLAVFACNAKWAAAVNSIPFTSVRFNTTQFSRSFILSTTNMWNGLPSAVVESSYLQNFNRGANSILLSVAVN